MEPAKLLEYEPEDAEQPTEGADQGQEEVADGPDPTGQQGGHGTRHVFSEQECLEALTRLIGLVALKIITPAQANSMRAGLEALLRLHQRRGRGDRGQTLDDDAVLKIFDRDPTVVDLLSPFLTEDQVELVMRRATRNHE